MLEIQRPPADHRSKGHCDSHAQMAKLHQKSGIQSCIVLGRIGKAVGIAVLSSPRKNKAIHITQLLINLAVYVPIFLVDLLCSIYCVGAKCFDKCSVFPTKMLLPAIFQKAAEPVTVTQNITFGTFFSFETSLIQIEELTNLPTYQTNLNLIQA